MKKNRMANGIPLLEPVEEDLIKLAQKFNIEFPIH